MRFSLFLGHKFHFGSQPPQWPKGLDFVSFQPAIAFICLMTLLGGPLYRFAKFALEIRRKVLVRRIDHCSLCWLCCYARCWMLQVMDNMEASGVIYVKVGTLTHLEQCKIFLLTVNKVEIIRPTVQHDFIVSVGFMWYFWHYLRQTSADILSLE